MTNLVIFGALFAVSLGLFWPGHGLFARLRRERRLNARVVMEDALKHIFHNERRGQTCTLVSIGGALGTGGDGVVSIVNRMQRAGLVTLTDNRILLTEEGRRYALQIIRAHRLWERYLADETGVDPSAWHAEAERREHHLSPEETDALASRLGDPRFDPHGDPIPTADGSMPHRRTLTLGELGNGDAGVVVHVEDEPDVLYRELLAAGVHPGMQFRVTDSDRVAIEADGRAITLSPIAAGNVSVSRAEVTSEVTDADGTLVDLRRGELAEVVRLSPACRGAERRRLMDLGIVPGTAVSFERRGLTGGLSAYRVRGTVVALREEQASMVSIRRPKEVAS